MDRYEAPKHKRSLFAKASHRKHISHYLNRLKFNFRESKIHMFMPSYRDNILRLFRLRLQRTDECPTDYKRLFDNERYWKLLCLPLLTPIKTAYNINNQNFIQRVNRSIPSTDDLEELICEKLSQNFQLVDTGQKTSEMIEQSYHLVKGSLYHHIIVQDRVNLNIRECQIVSFKEAQQEEKDGNKELVNRLDRRHCDMLYRYLCYEEKECRFVGRQCFFADGNNWKKDETAHTKTFKICFVIDTSNELTPDRERFRTTCRQNFREFIQAINEKYQGVVKEFPIVVA